jgi:hypothetical protein
MIEFRLKYFKLNQNLNKERNMRFSKLIVILFTIMTLFVGCDTVSTKPDHETIHLSREGGGTGIHGVDGYITLRIKATDLDLTGIPIEVKYGYDADDTTWPAGNYILGSTVEYASYPEFGMFFHYFNDRNVYYKVKIGGLGTYSDVMHNSGSSNWEEVEYSQGRINGLYMLLSEEGIKKDNTRDLRARKPGNDPPAVDPIDSTDDNGDGLQF